MNPLGQGLFGWVLETSWQAAVLALLVAGARKVFRRQLSPAWRYGLWLLVVVRLLLPGSPAASWSIYNLAKPPGRLKATEARASGRASMPALPPEIPVTEARRQTEYASDPAGVPERPAAGAPARTVSTSGAIGRTWDWRQVALYAWLVGVGFFAVRLGWATMRFSRRVGRGSEVASGPVLRLLNACQNEIGYLAPVKVIETPGIQSPAVCGLWRKRLLLPEGAMGRFTEEELRCVLLHELAHLRRRDLEVSWISSLLLLIHWFNPVLWLAFSRMSADREVACDALALGTLGARFAEPYGETIIKVVGNFLHPARPPGMLALTENRQRLKERMRMIAAFKERPRRMGVAIALVAGLVLVGLTNAGRARTGEPPAQPRAATEEWVIQPLHDQGWTSYDYASGLAQGTNGAMVQFPGGVLTADSLTLNKKTGEVAADGNVRIQREDQVWVGEHARYNLATREIQAQQFRTGERPLFAAESAPPTGSEPAPLILGKVVDKQTGQPVAAFQVRTARLFSGPVTPALTDPEVVQGSAGSFRHSLPRPISPDYALYVEAPGYRPCVRGPFNGEDFGKELLFELVRSEPMAGRVLTPQGTPAAQAEVRVWCGELELSYILKSHKAQSDQAGAFSIPEALDGWILVSHRSGYAEIRWEEFARTRTIRLAEWGHVKGSYPKPIPADGKAFLERINWSTRLSTLPPPWPLESTRLKAGGEFEFAAPVPPGDYMLWIGRQNPRAHDLDVIDHSTVVHVPYGRPLVEGSLRTRVVATANHTTVAYVPLGRPLVEGSLRAHVVVTAGHTTAVDVPLGRRLDGKIDLGGEQRVTNTHIPFVSLRSAQADAPLTEPGRRAIIPAFEIEKHFEGLIRDYSVSEAGKARWRGGRSFLVRANASGAFRIEHVTPGAYTLQVFTEPWDEIEPEIQRQVTIPDGPTESAIDLGLLKLDP